jgi:hypothetical protein
VELNDNKFWQVYIIVDSNEYFVHFAYNGIEMQTKIGDHRWYGRFEEVSGLEKKK